MNVSNKLVARQDNWLTQHTVNNFTHRQKQLLAILLGKYVNLTDNTCIDSSISVDELRKILGLTDGSINYTSIRKAINSFVKNDAVQFARTNSKGKTEIVWLHYFSSIILNEDQCVFTWNNLMKEHLLFLKGNFTQYEVGEFLKLDSGYSQRLFELFVSYKGYFKTYKKDPSLSVDYLKSYLRVDENEYYSTFKRFNDKILKPYIKEINETTHLSVEMSTVKKGRKIEECIFHIRDKSEKFDYNGCFLSQNEIDDIIYKYQAKNKIYDLARIKQTQPEKYKKLRRGGKSDYDIIINFINRDNVVQEQDITDYEEQTAYDGTTIEQGMFPF